MATRSPQTRPQPLRRSEPSARDAALLEAARAEAEHCQNCDLWRNATQTVFGEGPVHAPIMLVGEQPGDQEDVSGQPFVGPAGRMLDGALAQAGIERELVYVTNAVKHFKFEMRGKRRLHKKPDTGEIAACHQWLERELELVAPKLVVAMGATAARALLGRAAPIEKNRGLLQPFREDAQILITVHPSYLLRVPGEARTEAYRRFVDDLRVATPFQD